jgi:hypothetical protein
MNILGYAVLANHSAAQAGKIAILETTAAAVRSGFLGCDPASQKVAKDCEKNGLNRSERTRLP